ncbi:hypothetical protein [Streptomyces roseoverticillatus]|uniref:hypothetical protein n=1 Tax=Streptomyces roseoverticillatus TaxID=66429 RepID=UPI001F1D6418|nr:hypothetical protein [Streptomyces roseoverticillatus]
MILNLLGITSIIIGGYVVVRASKEVRTADVWREEAAAQKARADRLQDDLSEIKLRLTRIETENQRLVELLTALDPARVAALRIPR